MYRTSYFVGGFQLNGNFWQQKMGHAEMGHAQRARVSIFSSFFIGIKLNLGCMEMGHAHSYHHQYSVGHAHYQCPLCEWATPIFPIVTLKLAIETWATPILLVQCVIQKCVVYIWATPKRSIDTSKRPIDTPKLAKQQILSIYWPLMKKSYVSVLISVVKLETVL